MDEYPAIQPEKDKMQDQDYPQGDDKTGSYCVFKRHNCATAVFISWKQGLNWLIACASTNKSLGCVLTEYNHLNVPNERRK